MAAPIQSQPAYLLHSRPYRDTSMLLDFITSDFGRVSAVARGVRSPKSKTRASLQPFIPLLINLSGKSELKTLVQVESRNNGFSLKHKALFAAMYVNELLVRLLHKQEADTEIYSLYETTLGNLLRHSEIEPVLRVFELTLLELLGYGIDFSVIEDISENALRNDNTGDARFSKVSEKPHENTDNSNPDNNEKIWFHYHQENGFERVETENNSSGKYYPAFVLMRIADKNIIDPETQRFAKRLLRSALASHLGDKALSSRSLFRKNIA
tara:strand:+ start:5352 stop:6155 length:804 start_codon:yes stop_codon:yes gene_type:complete